MRESGATDIEARVAQAAKTLRIEHLLERKTDRLSGGEMQRVSIGRAIVREPRVFLMDEPLSNLDAKLREILRAELKDLQMKLGATFLYVTHDQVEAMSMGDRSACSTTGASCRSGTPQQIYNQPRDTFVATFVGSPAMNLLPARVADGRAVLVPGKLEVPLDGACPRARAGRRPADAGRAFRRHRASARAGRLKARVHGVENHGVETGRHLAGGRALLKATVPARWPCASTQRLRFAFNQEKLQWFDAQPELNLFSGEGGEKMAKVLFKNVNVLDCTGAPPFAGQVLVEGNRIKAVAPQGTPIAAEGAQAVDGGGATLMPGLVESHSHLTFLDTPDLEGLGFVPPEEHTLRTMKNAKKMLDQGFTACNSAASAKARLDVVIRNAINAGDIPGPENAGREPGAGDHRRAGRRAAAAHAPRDFRHHLRRRRRVPQDRPRDGARRRGHAEDQSVRRRVHPACARAPHRDDRSGDRGGLRGRAHAHGKRLAAHARSAESVKLCLKHGVEVIYHATLVDDEACAALEAAKDWCVRRADAGHHLHHAQRGRQVGHHHARSPRAWACAANSTRPART